METRLTVTVLGRKYELSGGEDEGHYRRVGEVVNRYIEEAALAAGKGAPEEAAVFAALRLADECLRAQAEADRLRWAREDAQAEEQPGADAIQGEIVGVPMADLPGDIAKRSQKPGNPAFRPPRRT